MASHDDFHTALDAYKKARKKVAEVETQVLAARDAFKKASQSLQDKEALYLKLLDDAEEKRIELRRVTDALAEAPNG